MSVPFPALKPADPSPPVKRKRIGDVLVAEKLITEQQLNRALSEARATGQPVGSVLVKLGFVSEHDLGRALASLHGTSYIQATDIQLEADVLRLLPETFMRQHLIVPIQLDESNKRLYVAMARPDNIKVLDEVALLTGFRAVPRVMPHVEVLNLLESIRNKQTSSDDVLAAMQANGNSPNDFGNNSQDDLQAEMDASDAPVVKLVNALLAEAVEANASDIHIEPQKERLLVRFRIDGILREVKSIPKIMASPVVSRIKVASGMDIAERRRPQDGRMKLTAGTQQIDMRVNSLAVQFGEKVVIRLLKPNATTGGLEKLGLNTDEVKRFNKMIRSPHGVILVTGPTGSGKTTTLYSCLREINTPERNISTIEDPIEYPLAGINQTQVSPKAGLTFASALRALLRQDPDVIMVGEIRDHETLEAAIHASLTGHLVFSTVHTNSTAKTVARLLEMGAPAYLVSTSIIGIVAQRLVRRICPSCKQPYEASDEEKELLRVPAERQLMLFKGAGCQACDHTGYRGRVGLYEIMNMSREIQQLVDSGGSAIAIEDTAVKEGMTTLGRDGKKKVLAGLTTVEEITRVLGLELH